MVTANKTLEMNNPIEIKVKPPKLIIGAVNPTMRNNRKHQELKVVAKRVVLKI